jgi:hypothetical protein
MARQINVANRWLYQATDGTQWRWGWRFVNENRVGGQMGYTPDKFDQIKGGYIYG